MFFLGYHCGKNAIVCKEKNSIRIVQLSADVNPLYKDAEIVSGLDARDVLLRNLHLKLKSKREILSALPFQVEHLLPYSQDELLLLPTLHPSEGETDVFLLATAKSTLEKHLIDLTTLQIDPDVVSCTPLALYRFANHFFPNHSSLFVYHCDEDEHTFIIIKEGRLYGSQVQRTEDLDRMCAYMQKKFPEIRAILHTGIDNLPTPFVPIEFNEPELAEYAIAIGLAIDAAKADQQSGQFRQETLSKKEVKRSKKNLFGFLAACAIFMVSTLALGHFHLKKREKETLIALGSPSGAKLQEVALQLSSSIRSSKNSALRISTIPKVHEVLNWLSTHSALSEEASITNLGYELVNIPKLGSTSKTYTATLTLELTMPSARIARIFHEALLNDYEMVDQKKPIHWSGDHGIYQAKFYLKPKNLK